MSKIFKAFAALALTFTLTTVDAYAGDDAALKIAKVGDEAADGAFGKANTLNEKLIDGQKKLETIKASVANASGDAAALKTASTDLTTLAADLASVPDDIQAIIKEAKGVKLSGNMMAKAKKVKAVAGNVSQLGKVTKNATALIKAVNDTSAEVAKSAEAAGSNAAEAAKDAAEGAAEGAVEAVKDAAGE